MSWKTVVGAGAVGALVLVGSPAAQADTPAPSPTGTPKAQKLLHMRATRLCRRVDRVERRVDRLVTRLQAGPGRVGSIKRLQARAGRIKATDPALAGIVQDRVSIRRSRLHTLELRQQELPKVAAWCASHGLKTSP